MKLLGKIVYPAVAIVGLVGIILSIIAVASTPESLGNESVWKYWSSDMKLAREMYPGAIKGAFGMATIGAIAGMIVSLGALGLGGAMTMKVWKGGDTNLIMFIIIAALGAAAFALSVAAIAESANLSNEEWFMKKMLDRDGLDLLGDLGNLI